MTKTETWQHFVPLKWMRETHAIIFIADVGFFIIIQPASEWYLSWNPWGDMNSGKTIRFENVCAFTRFKYSARIHPRLDTLANCHRQHLASGALPQLQLLSVAALASTKSVHKVGC